MIIGPHYETIPLFRRDAHPTPNCVPAWSIALAYGESRAITSVVPIGKAALKVAAGFGTGR